METIQRNVMTCLLLVAVFGNSYQSIRQRRQGFSVQNGESCKTPQNGAGVCINIKECPLHLNYLLNKRRDPSIVKYLQEALCRKQESQIFTCCPLQKSANLASGSTCQTPKAAAGECISIRKCPELLDMLQRRKEPGVAEYLRSSQCGVLNKDILVCCASNVESSKANDNLPGSNVCGLSDAANNRVVNGRPAALGSWPWMVALGYSSTKKPLEWLCGGTLISEKYVLTAAHCVTNIGRKTLYLARLGDLNLDDTVLDKASPVDIQIEKATPHEDYNAALHTVDIALVKLKDRVQYSKLIRPICLPLGSTFQPDLSGYSPFVIGWGATSYRGPSTTALQEAQIDITDLESCSNAYKSIKGATIDDRVICALSPFGKDACQGDSGGPLILPKQLNFYLIGVVSYGYKCAEPGFPGIYTKVALYIDWIKNNMS